DDLTAVALESSGEEPILMVSCYMAHDTDAPPRELRRMVEEAELRKKPLIIGADANAHHTVWGSKDVNERGESLLDFILSMGLTISNEGEEPTYVGPTSTNVLDLTLKTEGNTEVTEWRVLSRPSFSDHRYIEFRVEFNRSDHKLPRRNPRNTNWEKYGDIVNRKLPEPPRIESPEDIERALEKLNMILVQAFHKSCKLSRPKKSFRAAWWTRSLQNTRREVQELFKLAKQAEEAHVWNEYKTRLSDFKKDVRKAKRNSWQTFCSGIEKASETARLRKLLAGKQMVQSQLRTEEGRWTEDSEDAVRTLLDAHFPGCIEAGKSMQITPLNAQQVVPEDLITLNKIIWAIDSFDGYKSSGPDEIFPAMLQKVKTKVSPWLKNIFIGCLRYSHVPG
ncbi:hypothetical protein KR018_005286, partial [Drosophila ironensis]